MNINTNSVLKAIFTNEDKDRIRSLLSSYHIDKVNSFISSLNYLCSLKVRYIHLSSLCDVKHNETASNRRNLLNNCKSLHIKLSRLINNFGNYVKPELPYFDIVKNIDGNVEFSFDTAVGPNHDYSKLKEEADKLNNAVVRFISIIEPLNVNQNHYLSKGRKMVDKDMFYSQLAELYHIHISEPTQSKDGEFANLVRIVNEITGIKKGEHDPSRSVKQAIDSLRNKHNEQNE